LEKGEEKLGRFIDSVAKATTTNGLERGEEKLGRFIDSVAKATTTNGLERGEEKLGRFIDSVAKATTTNTLQAISVALMQSLYENQSLIGTYCDRFQPQPGPQQNRVGWKGDKTGEVYRFSR
jgi:hypothetical protein